MKIFPREQLTETIKYTVFGLFVNLLFCSSVMAGEPTSSQLSYFNVYKSVYGNSWNMVWNNGNSTPLAFYGGHFIPQKNSSSTYTSNLNSPQTNNALSSVVSSESSACTPSTAAVSIFTHVSAK
jgi:hypothetical protein